MDWYPLCRVCMHLERILSVMGSLDTIHKEGSLGFANGV